MFTDFVDDSLNFHRGWTTFFSFGLQFLTVGGLLLLPLLYPQALPRLQLLGREMVAPPPPPGPPPAPPRPHPAGPVSTNMSGEQIVTPPHIPDSIANLHETTFPPPEVPIGPWVPGGTGRGGDPNGVFGSIGMAVAPPLIPAPPATATRPHVSHMMEGNLIYRVQPEYPALARQARIQGTVILHALISRDGRIANLQLISGHPLLVKAATDAVRQWRYRPYFLNDQAVEVETQITVNFTLSGGS
jgi:periplasmic protein TonB